MLEGSYDFFKVLPSKVSVLEGYNGTVMAYGQTGTGKTFTLRRLGDEDTFARDEKVGAPDIVLVFSDV